MNKLQISQDIKPLPLEAVTETFGIMATKGSGKSYTASVFAEEMLKANQQCVMIDYTGAWWGLQSSADGKSEGFPVVIFGGDHANIPLEETAGEIIAQSIVEQGFSAIIDLSLFRKAQSLRFLAPFLETLYRLNRNPLHLFADEADAYVPQKVFGEQARTVGAMEDIVRRGRKKGIGCTLITQRPASINKDVLTQCEILIALRMNHPRDMNAIKEWVDVHATIREAKDMMESLPSMETGTAWIWSPSWLKVFKQIRVRQRETFDSGATPKPGEIKRQPKKLAAIDIKSLGKAIEETVERKKADNPTELKKKVAELQRQLNQKPSEKPMVVQRQVDTSTIETFKAEILKHRTNADEYYKIIQTLKREAMKYQTVFNKIGKLLDELKEAGVEINMPAPEKIKMPEVKFTVPEKIKAQVKIPGPLQKHLVSSAPVHQVEQNGNGSIGRCERAILTVLAQRNGKNSSKSQLGILSGYSPSSGGFNNSISKLRQHGYLDGAGDALVITDDGLMQVGEYEPLPSGSELHTYWKNKLPPCESKILDYLIQVHPNSYNKEDIGTATGYSHSSGGFNNSLSKLRTLQLVEGYGSIKAVDSLFE